jgi:2-deoxy-D-gluconate 3-dehydrogenase
LALEQHQFIQHKGAVVQLTMSLANAWGRDNIQVNSVLPGWIKTDLTEQTRSLPNFMDKVLDRTPAGRWGDRQILLESQSF